MNILITGATGCLGKNLALRLLKSNHDIHTTGRNEISASIIVKNGALFTKADICNREEIIELCKNKDIVFHCAALSSNWGRYDDFYQANVVGTKNIIEGCKKHKVSRLIYVSTPSIYFDFSDRFNIKENDALPFKSVNHYAATKLLAEKEIDKAFNEGLDVITIRPRAIFGPYDTSIIPRIIRLSKKGSIPLINDGNNIIDVTYVDNVVEALIKCMEANENAIGEKYNITNGSPISLKNLLLMLFEKLNMRVSFRKVNYKAAYLLAGLIENIFKITDKEPKLTRYSVGVLSKSQTLDITKAKKDLGYTPEVTIEKGLEHYAKWLRESYES